MFGDQLFFFIVTWTECKWSRILLSTFVSLYMFILLDFNIFSCANYADAFLCWTSHAVGIVQLRHFECIYISQKIVKLEIWFFIARIYSLCFHNTKHVNDNWLGFTSTRSIYTHVQMVPTKMLIITMIWTLRNKNKKNVHCRIWCTVFVAK